MGSKLRLLGFAAALAAGASSPALAQVCPPGYMWYGGVCQPAQGYNYGNPVSGAVSGEAAGAAAGNAAAGPVGAVVGGALGIAAGTVSGTANAVGATAPPPACGPGYYWYNGACYRR